MEDNLFVWEKPILIMVSLENTEHSGGPGADGSGCSVS
jgi:hypothetical protein